MLTFEDCLLYYNNLDVELGLKALEKMRNFYTEKGIDILKDMVGMPGISFHYLLCGAMERGTDLYSPGREAYEMLKWAVVGGPSLVFTRRHQAGVTGIRSHQFEEPRLCKKILGFDASALYLSTFLREMPCRKETVVHYNDDRQAEATEVLIRQFKAGECFGFAEVRIQILERLRPMFKEMCPFFHNKHVPAEAVPEHMKEYLARTGRQRGDGRKLVGALSAERMLVYAPLLRWYVINGAVVTKVSRAIDYEVGKIFTWFVEQVTEARQTGDTDRSKALLAKVFKLALTGN